MTTSTKAEKVIEILRSNAAVADGREGAAGNGFALAADFVESTVAELHRSQERVAELESALAHAAKRVAEAAPPRANDPVDASPLFRARANANAAADQLLAAFIDIGVALCAQPTIGTDEQRVQYATRVGEIVTEMTELINELMKEVALATEHYGDA